MEDCDPVIWTRADLLLGIGVAWLSKTSLLARLSERTCGFGKWWLMVTMLVSLACFPFRHAIVLHDITWANVSFFADLSTRDGRLEWRLLNHLFGAHAMQWQAHQKTSTSVGRWAQAVYSWNFSQTEAGWLLNAGTIHGRFYCSSFSFSLLPWVRVNRVSRIYCVLVITKLQKYFVFALFSYTLLWHISLLL